MLGRRLWPAGPNDTWPGSSGARSSVADLAPGIGMTDTVRVAGTALPLWLVVGSFGFVVLAVVAALMLTLRDRERGSLTVPTTVKRDDLPPSVRFG